VDRGIEPDWEAFYKEERQLIALPSYVFDRKQCWIDPHKLKPLATITSTPNSISNRNENKPMRKLPSLAKLPLL
jgi:acyl transferase domain-containing protein